jgi:hypothetical protein
VTPCGLAGSVEGNILSGRGKARELSWRAAGPSWLGIWLAEMREGQN